MTDYAGCLHAEKNIFNMTDCFFVLKGSFKNHSFTLPHVVQNQLSSFFHAFVLKNVLVDLHHIMKVMLQRERERK